MNIHFRKGYRQGVIIVVLAFMTVVGMMLPVSAQDTDKISIPVLGVDVTLTSFLLNGVSWDISPWESGIGHLEGTSWFDAGGNIALGGHSWLPNHAPGIFANLHTLQNGDEIEVTVDGVVVRYTVTGVTTVSMFDMTVLYPTEHEQLTLITCDVGSYNPESSLYDRRVVVSAERTS